MQQTNKAPIPGNGIKLLWDLVINYGERILDEVR